MYWVFDLLLLTIPAQWYFGSGAPWWVVACLFCTIGRLLCVGRVIGITLKFRVFVVFESIGTFFMLIGCILTKKELDLVAILLFLGIVLVAIIFYLIDDKFYVYITEEVTEKNEQ